MEPREQLQIKTFLILIFSGVLFVGCSRNTQKQLTILMSDPLLKKEKGIYSFDGLIYSGVLVKLYENKDTAEIALYENGKREGVTRRWWENGNLKSEISYKLGEYNGSAIEWYENGNMFSSFNYILGSETGKQQMWNKDGSFKANYDVIGDRKYGLTGVKNCSNVWEN